MHKKQLNYIPSLCCVGSTGVKTLVAKISQGDGIYSGSKPVQSNVEFQGSTPL